jgi:hypothetical protein
MAYLLSFRMENDPVNMLPPEWKRLVEFLTGKPSLELAL